MEISVIEGGVDACWEMPLKIAILFLENFPKLFQLTILKVNLLVHLKLLLKKLPYACPAFLCSNMYNKD